MIQAKMELPFKESTNAFYAGMHYRRRNQLKNDMTIWCKKHLRYMDKFTSKVDIHMDFYFKSHPLDSSNCSIMFKMIEDNLIKLNVITKDSIKGVGKISMESHKASSNYVEISIKLNKS